MSAKKRVPASQQGRRPRHHSNGCNSSAIHRPQDGFTAPSAEDRAEAALLAEAVERGFRLAVQCKRCGQWLVAERSVVMHMGPVCRTKGAGR